MEFIVFLLIVIFVFINSGGKNKKRPPVKQVKPVKPVRAPGKGVKLNVKMEDLMTRLEQQLDEKMAALEEAGEKIEEKFEEIDVPEPVRAEKVSAGEKRARRAAVMKKRELRQAARAQAAVEVDAEGCVGGSMEHDHHEGESREEHSRHIAEADHREREATLAVQTAQALGEMNLRRLRQAVVMAEILDRPKALRRR